MYHSAHAALLKSAVAVLAGATLISCGSLRSGSDGNLPVLRIGQPGVAEAAANGGDKLFKIDGDLPLGPAEAPVYRFTEPVDADAVTQLAEVLGLSGALDRHDHGWSVRDGGRELRVRDDGAGPWAYSFGGPDDCGLALDIDRKYGPESSVGCAIANDAPRSTVAPTVQGPSEAQAFQMIDQIVDALKLGGTSTHTYVGSPTTMMTFDPEIDDQSTVGLATTFTIGISRLLSASGSLAVPTQAQSYPILPAEKALERMPMIRPMMACPIEEGAGDSSEPAKGAPDRFPGICDQGPIVITGATLVRSLSYDDGEPVLVPAWRYDVANQPDGPVAIAVTNDYLGDPTTFGTPDQPEPPPSVGPGDPGQTEPGKPGQGEPGQPDAPTVSGQPATPGAIAITSASNNPTADASGRLVYLTGWGGVCDTYAALLIAEDAKGVTVQIVGKSRIEPGQACTDQAVEVRVDVKLAEPLGQRVVIDATTGQDVPVVRAQ